MTVVLTQGVSLLKQKTMDGTPYIYLEDLLGSASFTVMFEPIPIVTIRMKTHNYVDRIVEDID